MTPEFMTPRRILLPHTALAPRTGGVFYLRDLALGLLARGHTPIVFTSEVGEVGKELRQATVPVITRLAEMSVVPDVIYGQTPPETLAALLYFPNVSGVLVCHGWDHWLTEPIQFPRLRRHVPVDDTCREWLVCERGVPVDRVRVIRNPVDLSRFRARAALPARPVRALVFSNYFNADNGLNLIREACHLKGIALDVVGTGVFNECTQPERILGNYDLVFAKARCALEALAVGAAVIPCNPTGAAPLVTTKNLDQLWSWNFGRRALAHPLSVDFLTAQIDGYDMTDAATVSMRVRDEGNLDRFLDRVVAVCEEAIEEQACSEPASMRDEQRAAADYLPRLMGSLQGKLVQSIIDRALRAENDAAGLQAEVTRLTDHWNRMAAEVEHLRDSYLQSQAIHAHLQESFLQLQESHLQLQDVLKHREAAQEAHSSRKSRLASCLRALGLVRKKVENQSV